MSAIMPKSESARYAMHVEKSIETSMRMELKSLFDKDGSRYIVITENHLGQQAVICTSVFKDAELLSTEREFVSLPADPLDAVALKEMIGRHHDDAIGKVLGRHVTCSFKSSSSLLAWAREQVAKQNKKKAYEVLEDALEFYNEDPHVLTYYGSMASLFAGEHEKGIDACVRALSIMRERSSGAGGRELVTFYLNLARACASGGDRRCAVETLLEGSRYDRRGGMIHKELVKLGIRRRPPLPFLERENLINKYLGIVLYRWLRLGANRPLEAV